MAGASKLIRKAAVFICLLAWPEFVSQSASAASDLNVPHFFDASERMPKPDLSGIGQIRFTTTTDFPPFNFLDKSGRLSGFHVDLARALCAELSLADKCSIQSAPWGELAGQIGSGQADAVLAGIDINPETRRQYNFTRAFLQFPARFAAGKQTDLKESTGLNGVRVGVVARSAHEDLLRAYFPLASVVTYDRPEWALDDLRSGKTEAVFGDGMRLSFWLSGEESKGCCKLAGGAYLAPEYLGAGLTIATAKGNPELAAALDHALRQVEAKGIFTELYLRYFPVSFY